jgi:hypothetical protein
MKGRNLLASMALASLICALISTTAVTKQNLIFDGQVRSTSLSKTVPTQLNYQGYLADASDSSAITATLEMTFRIFNSETDGTELWLETHSAVEVKGGLFQVLLGSVTSFPSNLFDGSPLWLQTEVGTEVLAPRKPLVSSAYSRRAEMADHAETADWATDAQNAVHADTADHCPGVGAWTVSGDDVYRETGKVGIGTSSPLTELDVTGSVNATTYYGDGSNLTGISGTTDNDWTISGNHMYSAVPGSVGIGTSSPSAKLDVRGTLKVGENFFGHDVNLWGINWSGSRVFWDADKVALRVGRDTDGHHWAPDSVGMFSFATGVNTKARGEYSTAMGNATTASGNYSTAMGRHTTASGENSFTMGLNSIASRQYTIAIGRHITAEADDAIIIGRGTDFSNHLINDIESSLLVGFEPDEPTLFVGGPDHRVGIGTTSPSAHLHVGGRINTDSLYEIGGLPVLSGSSSNQNVYIGYQAGMYASGFGLTCVGYNAGQGSGGTNNTSVGWSAGIKTTGNWNTLVGTAAGYENTTGQSNTFIGYRGGQFNDTGSHNTYLGYMAGYSNLSGSGNLFLGYQAGYNEMGSNKLYIDNSHTSSPLLYGEFDNDILTVNGNLGLGLTSPNRSLYIAENVNGLSYPLKIDNYNGNWNATVGILFSSGGNGTPSGVLNTARGKGALVYEYTATWNRGDFHFLQNTATDSTNPELADAVMTIQNDGKVGIGTTTPGYQLDVNGDINVAGSYNIKKGGTNYTHPDYVFEPDYELMPLDELREHVFREKSLPNVISAEDVKNNDGFKMDELLVQMLEKIEEQTLYIFQLEERIATLEEKR